jgi:Family of unknown function (DUF6804)
MCARKAPIHLKLHRAAGFARTLEKEANAPYETGSFRQEMRNSMLTKFMKWISAAVLLLAVFGRFSANFVLILEFVVCVTGLLVIMQAVRLDKYFWASGFLVITVLFNPVVPVELSTRLFFLLDLSCLVAFVASLRVLKARPVLSIPSITGRRSIIEAL